MRNLWHAEPAAVIGFLAAAIVLVGQQALASGIVSSAGSVNLLNLVISLTPMIAALIIRNFVSPATVPPTPPPAIGAQPVTPIPTDPPPGA